MELTASRILLTGATGGLGRELARQLAESGAALLLAGRDAAKLDALISGIGGTGRKLDRVVADLSTAEGVAAAAEAARAFGVNVLINNAGILAFGLFDEQTWGSSHVILETNLAAPMRLTHALLPTFKTKPHAAIVNIGSTFGSLPFPGFAAYSAAKAGLRAFSQSLRRELADGPVEVIHVAPRAIATALNTSAVNALNRDLGSTSDTPESVARQIVAAIRAGRGERHLGFPERLFAWINGSFPALIDRVLAGKLAIVKRHASITP
jgi:short-subunit dehydrogenase